MDGKKDRKKMIIKIMIGIKAFLEIFTACGSSNYSCSFPFNHHSGGFIAMGIATALVTASVVVALIIVAVALAATLIRRLAQSVLKGACNDQDGRSIMQCSRLLNKHKKRRVPEEW